MEETIGTIVGTLIGSLTIMLTPVGGNIDGFNEIDFAACPYVETVEEVHAAMDDAIANGETEMALRLHDMDALTLAGDILYEAPAYINDYEATYQMEAGGNIDVLFNISYTAGYVIISALDAGDEAGLAAEQAQTLAAARKVLDELQLDGADDVGRELAIHDWLVENIVYDAGNDISDAYDALVTGVTHCVGYSDAFYLLGRLAGLEVYYMDGYADGGAHAWNMVRLGDRSYFVDVTWDDYDDGYEPAHDYFNIPDKALKTTHEYDETRANADIAAEFDENNYFEYTGRLAEKNGDYFRILESGVKNGERHMQVASGNALNLDIVLLWLDSEIEDVYGTSDDVAYYESEMAGRNIYDVWFDYDWDTYEAAQ